MSILKKHLETHKFIHMHTHKYILLKSGILNLELEKNTYPNHKTRKNKIIKGIYTGRINYKL